MDSTLTIILMWKLTGNVVVSGSWSSRLNNGVGWRETGWGPPRFWGLARPSTLAKIQYRLLMPVSMTGEQDPGTLKQFMRDIMSLHPNCSFFFSLFSHNLNPWHRCTHWELLWKHRRRTGIILYTRDSLCFSFRACQRVDVSGVGSEASTNMHASLVSPEPNDDGCRVVLTQYDDVLDDNQHKQQMFA